MVDKFKEIVSLLKEGIPLPLALSMLIVSLAFFLMTPEFLGRIFDLDVLNYVVWISSVICVAGLFRWFHAWIVERRKTKKESLRNLAVKQSEVDRYQLLKTEDVAIFSAILTHYQNGGHGESIYVTFPSEQAANMGASKLQKLKHRAAIQDFGFQGRHKYSIKMRRDVEMRLLDEICG